MLRTIRRRRDRIGPPVIVTTLATLGPPRAGRPAAPHPVRHGHTVRIYHRDRDLFRRVNP